MKKNSRKPDKHLHFAVLAIDAVCFCIKDGKLSVLLGKVVNAPAFRGMWAAIGGLIDVKETAEEAVERHLRDKAGILGAYKKQLHTFSSLNRDPRGRVISVAYVTFADPAAQDLSRANAETKWCPISGMPHLAYDHDEIIRLAVLRLREEIEYTAMAQYFLPKEFTLSELQKVHEIVLGKAIDKRNFRKKIISSGRIKETGNTRKAGIMRPAALYRFSSAA